MGLPPQVWAARSVSAGIGAIALSGGARPMQEEREAVMPVREVGLKDMGASTFLLIISGLSIYYQPIIIRLNIAIEAYK
jgi:hypothetical protein